MATNNQFGARNIGEFLNKSKFTDVEFILNKKDGSEMRIAANRHFLASCSPVFSNMFFGDLKTDGNVHITDATAEGFTEFLQLFYKPEVNLTIENISEVTELIIKHNIIDCLETVKTFLKDIVTIENVCICYEVTIRFQLSPELVNEFEEIIRKQSKQALRSPGFKMLNEKTVCNIFMWDYLSCDEKTVFDAAVVWAGNASNRTNVNRRPTVVDIKTELREIVKFVRFHTMTLDQFHDILWKHPDLFTTADSTEIVNFIKTGGQNKNTKEEFKLRPRSPKLLIPNGVVFINAINSQCRNSEILFKGSEEHIDKVLIYRLELALSLGDEVIEFEDGIDLHAECVWQPGEGFTQFTASHIIEKDKIWYNPEDRRYICQIEPPFEIKIETHYRDVEQYDERNFCPLFTLKIQHPPVGAVTQNFLNEVKEIDYIEIDCSKNAAVVGIGIKVD